MTRLREIRLLVALVGVAVAAGCASSQPDVTAAGQPSLVAERYAPGAVPESGEAASNATPATSGRAARSGGDGPIDRNVDRNVDREGPVDRRRVSVRAAPIQRQNRQDAETAIALEARKNPANHAGRELPGGRGTAAAEWASGAVATQDTSRARSGAVLSGGSAVAKGSIPEQREVVSQARDGDRGAQLMRLKRPEQEPQLKLPKNWRPTIAEGDTLEKHESPDPFAVEKPGKPFHIPIHVRVCQPGFPEAIEVPLTTP